MEKYFIGIDIGGTKIAVLLAPYCKDFSKIQINDFIIDRIEFVTPIGDDACNAVPQIVKTVYSILKSHSIEKNQITSVGISCGGPINSKKGIILNPPNLFNWNNVPIVDLLTEEFKTKVRLQNDANACALAEWIFGAGRGVKNMIFLTMGTGMGAGLILNGQLYSGTNDMAGEIGHIRLSENGPVGFGKEGSFEAFCGGRGIAQVAHAKALEKLQTGHSVKYCNSIEELPRITAKNTADAADDGDITAIEAYEKVGLYLGRGLSILIDILNPQKIVIGSIYFKSKNLLDNTMYAEIQKEALKTSRDVCEIVPCELGNKIGDFGAIATALYE